MGRYAAGLGAPFARRISAVALVALLFLPAAWPARADWLVMNDGGRVETDGPWQIKGKLVVFRSPAGRLSSLRLAEIDLGASEAATRAAEEAARKAEQEAAEKKEATEKKKPAFVITDADVRSVPEPIDTGEGDAAGASSEAEADASLRVTSWDRLEDDPIDGVAIAGVLAHSGTDLRGSIELLVELFDSAGALMVAQPATLSAAVLRPGQQASFRAEFVEIFDFSGIKFTPRSVGIVLRDRGEPAAEGEDVPPGDLP